MKTTGARNGWAAVTAVAGHTLAAAGYPIGEEKRSEGA